MTLGALFVNSLYPDLTAELVLLGIISDIQPLNQDSTCIYFTIYLFLNWDFQYIHPCLRFFIATNICVKEMFTGSILNLV